MAERRDVFAAEAASYEAWYTLPAGQRADVLEKGLLERLRREAFPQAQSVLDLGCGTGHFTRWFGEQGLSVVGLDASAAMLAQARAISAELALLRGDMEHLPFGDGAFDLVVLVTALEFVADPRAALAEAWRVSRQGLLLGVLNRSSALGRELRRVVARQPESVYAHAHLYSVAELTRLVRGVAGPQARLDWRTTLWPRGWPLANARLPWGGFIGLAAQKRAR
ncbi:MAG: class I SAM-dependent methyltransferase [Anaerolineales bacterium]